VCFNTTVQVMEERCVTKYISVPSVETRTVMKRVEVCRPETVHHRKLVRLGHYECCEVPRLFGGHSHGGCGDSCGGCGGCETSCTRTVRKWKYCPEYEDCCETRMVKHTECVPECVQVNVCKKVPVQEKVKVCVNKCVPQTRCETYTCCVPKCVPYQACRKVCVCVPCTETVTCCRMVCRQVAKQVCEAPCAPTCETTSCCDSGCGGHRFHFSGFRGFRGHGGCGGGCDSGCGGCH
jgi:hypothetical protein